MAFVLHTSLVILCTIKGSHEFDLVGFFLPAMKCGTTTLQWLVNCDFRIYYAQIQTENITPEYVAMEFMKYPHDIACI